MEVNKAKMMEDTGRTCIKCYYEDLGSNEFPCNSCINACGNDDMWKPKDDPDKAANPVPFEACVMDSEAWQEFAEERLGVIVKNREEFDDLMKHCRQRGIKWASEDEADEFVPKHLKDDSPRETAIYCDRHGMYWSCASAEWVNSDERKCIYYGGALTPGLPDPADEPEEPSIKDSGKRRGFESGAVRDICEGKGRCDLMPLDVLGAVMQDPVFSNLADFMRTRKIFYLYNVLDSVSGKFWSGKADMFLELARHFEDGAKKYGERNWEKGLPIHCYIDSAARHYLKRIRGDKDEPHDRAFVWNIVCCIWTMMHKPEMDDLPKREEKEND